MFSLGREGVIELNGTMYHLSRLGRNIVVRFFDFIREQEGDPIAETLKLLPFLDGSQKDIAVAQAKSRAQQLKVRSLSCPIATEYLNTELGQCELLWLLLLEKQPHLTREDAFRIWTEVGARAVADKINEAQGQPPPAQNALAPA